MNYSQEQEVLASVPFFVHDGWDAFLSTFHPDNACLSLNTSLDRTFQAAFPDPLNLSETPQALSASPSPSTYHKALQTVALLLAGLLPRPAGAPHEWGWVLSICGLLVVQMLDKCLSHMVG